MILGKDRKICLVILMIIVAGVSAFHCPEDKKCSCYPNYEGGFEIYCPLLNNSAFSITIQPGDYVKVDCIDSPKWSDFHLNKAFIAKNEVESMYFRMCDLPDSTSLNEITRLLGISNIKRLVFQSYKNLSSTLNKHHLQGFEDLKHLILSSNNISYLDKDLLINFPNLTGLNLRENNLHLSTGLFNHTPELTWLELGSNNMETIESGTFDNLQKLTLLNLWKNRLTQLQPRIFDKLLSLNSLDLNTNNMANLPKDIFAKLVNLETLNLSRNNFTQLPEGLLANNINLHTVSLFDNKQNLTTLPKGLFRNLIELKVLKLKRNGLVTLPEDVFWGSFSLANVSLERNYIKQLPANIFRDSKQLTILELSFNELENLPDLIFSHTSRLIKLDLSRNHITSISRYTFSGLYALEELNLKQNHLVTISDHSFSSLGHLKIAIFSDNNLTLKPSFAYRDEYGSKSPFHDSVLLEELYLDNNNISEIFSDWILSNLKLRVLDLRYNNISLIFAEDLQFISGSIKVDLSHNKIQHIFLHDAEQLASFQDTPRDVIILIENNPLTCDCDLYDFLRYIEGKMHPNVQNYFHIIPGNLTCQGPMTLENINVTELKSASLTCMIKSTGHNVVCSEQCDCFLRPEDNTFIADCSYKNLTRIPNDIKKPSDFWKLELNFSNNMLTEMPVLKELGLESVNKLFLSRNNITEISLDRLSDTIQVLELHNNNMSRITPDVLEFLKNSKNLNRMTLHSNPWICDCEARDLLSFIQTKFVNIPELLEVSCHKTNISISEMTPTDFCPIDLAAVISISVIISFLGLLLGLLGVYYRYQKHIKIWLYAHQWCLWLVTEEELDKDKLYDAFISYSHKDQDFVLNELVPKLENGPKKFKLCLHFRDWLAGEWIPTQIIRSVEDSRRTLVILSPNFLESVWGRMEFRAAHNHALSEGRARVILILYGDIGPISALDLELKTYLSMNTYVKWGDPWFWDKLRYALPHPHLPTKKKIRKLENGIFENHQMCIQVNGNKKEVTLPTGFYETIPTSTILPDALKIFIHDKKSQEQPLSSDLLQNTKSYKLKDDDTLIVKSEELLKNKSLIDKIQCTNV